MILFENRNDMIRYYLKPSMIGAELGVFAGEFSEILVQIDPLKLYLVDFFLGIQGSGDLNGENMVYIDMDIAMKTIVQKYEHDTRVCVVQKTTQDFLYGLENNCLDFVYIDADHSYEAIRSDINIAFNKVKVGGYILGHDYVSPRFDGVVRAVNEFCSSNSLSICAMSKCGCPSYCIQVAK